MKNPSYRNIPVTRLAQHVFGKEFDLLFEVDARDDRSGVPVPTHKQSFKLTVVDDALLLSP
jgi:hypothetical protein